MYIKFDAAANDRDIIKEFISFLQNKVSLLQSIFRTFKTVIINSYRMSVLLTYAEFFLSFYLITLSDMNRLKLINEVETVEIFFCIKSSAKASVIPRHSVRQEQFRIRSK